MEVQDIDTTVNEEEGAMKKAEGLNEKAAGLRERAGSLAKSMAEERKVRLTERLDNLTGALRNASEQLRGQESGKLIAGYIDTVSGKIEQVSSYLNEKEVQELIEAGKKVIKKRPVIALAGVFAAGFIVARVLKSAGRPAMTERRKTGGTYA